MVPHGTYETAICRTCVYMCACAHVCACVHMCACVCVKDFRKLLIFILVIYTHICFNFFHVGLFLRLYVRR